MEKNSDEWYNWCLSESDGHKTTPGDWGRMSEFKQLLLLKALRPDRVAAALQRFCENAMGLQYVNQEAFSPAAVLAESSRCV
jgi:dynein heavy chain